MINKFGIEGARGYCLLSKATRCMSMSEFRELRDALGMFATGVTVITTMTDDGPLGITANSFASLSLDPPLVLWSPARKSSRFPAFDAAKHFAVHVISEEQQTLSDAFARRGDQFDGFDWQEGIGKSPLFPDCAARFECVKAAGYDGGDHKIMVGEVLRFTSEDRRPLVYHSGKYQTIT